MMCESFKCTREATHMSGIRDKVKVQRCEECHNDYMARRERDAGLSVKCAGCGVVHHENKRLCYVCRPEDRTTENKTPLHYKRGGLIGWDAIEAWGLNYKLGNALKYIMRAGHKTPDPTVDLKKAIRCIERELECIELRNG